MYTILKEKIKNRIFKKEYFSQDCEDYILSKIFSEKQKGFFVDIGAHHPTRYSNTYKFYKDGWTGINIDPRPGIMQEFNKQRPLDINLEIAVSETEDEANFYIFDEPGVNTLDKEIAYGRNLLNGYKLIEVKKIHTKSLEQIFESYLINNSIDFLNIDVEGHEFTILKSNNWKKYRPKVIVCEMIFENFENNPTVINCRKGSEYWSLTENLKYFDTHNLLVENGYGVLSKTIGSVFYVDKLAKWQ